MPNQKINFQIPVVGGASNTNEDNDVRVIYPVAGHFVSTSFMVARVMARRQGHEDGSQNMFRVADRCKIFTFLAKYRRIRHAHALAENGHGRFCRVGSNLLSPR